MPTGTKQDNSTYRQKAMLQRKMLAEIDSPVVMETHGGFGRIWRSCYSHIPTGVVFEKDPRRADVLARQRPTWAVYEADCVGALQGGAGAHLEVNVLDVDPYGDPWPAIKAFLGSERPRVSKLWVVVNDGLRQKVQMGGAWSTETLGPMVARFGNSLHRKYLDVCAVLMTEAAAQAGYNLDRFGGYYCNPRMTHYLAVLSR